MMRPILPVLLILLVWGHTTLRAQAPATPISIGAEILPNGDFTTATKDPTWPDGWRRKPWLTWGKTAKGMRYLRFVTDQPGQTHELSREFPVPPGAKALHVTFRYRISNLKVGLKEGQDARVSFSFFDAVRIKFYPAPEPIILSGSASDWTEVTRSFAVPANAVSLAIAFGLYQVEAGTLDVADIHVTSANESVVSDLTAASAPDVSTALKAKEDVPIRREGNHTIFGYGKPSIWLIHPYVDVLGHDFDQGITHLVSEARDQGHSIAVGVAGSLDPVNLQDEANTIYVFSYKNINYPLPANARRLIFLNTWMLPLVQWPASRTGKSDLVLLGSRTLHNNGDGLATDKDRWTQIQKDDPTLTITMLDSTGYYLPLSVWRAALLKVMLAEPVH